ncbi:MAG: DMT family transporter [Bacteroidales bacterium]
MKKSQITAYISIILAMTFWSLTYVWYKQAFEAYNPITIVLLRLILSSVILVLLMYPIKQLQKLDLSDLRYFILVTFFQPFLYFLCESFGVKLVSSTLSAVIISTIPLFSPFVTMFFFKEIITKLNIWGIILSVTGVALVMFSRSDNSTLYASPWGILILFCAVAAGIGYSIVVKKLTEKYNSISIVTYHNIIGIFFFLPLFFIFEYDDFMETGYAASAVIPLLELAVFGSSFAFIFFTFSIKKIGITKSNAFTNAIPVLTAIFAFFILGETLTVVKMTGIGLVISGLFMSQIKRMPIFRKREEPIRPNE